MADVITRKDVYQFAKDHKLKTRGMYTTGYNNAMNDVMSAVMNAELIRPAESGQVSGFWILAKPRRENRNPTFKCSVCGSLRSSYYNDVQNWRFCPCGALMKGIEKEEPECK